MNEVRGWRRVVATLRAEFRHLASVQPSDRPWQMPLAAALALGLPLLAGAACDRLADGLTASLGGLAFLYLPETPLHHRMVALMASAFAITACFALGLASQLFPAAMVPALGCAAILVTMVCRYFNLAPPGSMFFIMAAAIGAYTPGGIEQLPFSVGLVFLGTAQAGLIAFLYSLYMLRRRPPRAVPPLPPASFDFVVLDSVIIGGAVALALALAQALRLENAYWVPVSCLAVIQGMSLRAVWNKHWQRIIGTGIGMLLAWGLLLLPLGPWGIALAVMALAFVIEIAVVRHYGVAVVFITPLTILLVEAGSLGQGASAALIGARFLDTVLGCTVGLAGGYCLHSLPCRAVLGRAVRRLLPVRT